MVSFVIGPSGDVASAVVGESTVSDEGFAACLVERVRTWRFPAPAGGGEVQVNYPWVVKVAGSEE
jgi:TonB family protein